MVKNATPPRVANTIAPDRPACPAGRPLLASCAAGRSRVSKKRSQVEARFADRADMGLHEEKIGWSHSDDPGEPTTGKPRLSISDKEAEILSALAAGKTVLEIGTGLGVSTRALARYAYAVDTIDVDPWVAGTIVPKLLEECPNVRAFGTREGHEFYDLVFIDGSHDTNAVLDDLAFAEQHILGSALIVCHDARYSNVRQALIGDSWNFIQTEHVLAYRYLR